MKWAGLGSCDFFRSALAGRHRKLLFEPLEPWMSVDELFAQFYEKFMDIFMILCQDLEAELEDPEDK